MPTTVRFLRGSAILAAVATCGVPAAAVAQQPAAAPLPASAVMARGVGDGWHSQGGVAGPWWGGGANVAGGPGADGGFWFGWPGLGFGGVQGSSRNVGATTAAVTTMPGAAGTISSGRLVPFVTGVVPVVGDGFAVTAVTAGPTLPPTGGWQPALVPPPRMETAPNTGSSAVRLRPSTPGSRDRARAAVAAGDRRLLAAAEDRAAARAAVADYRTAARLADDDADIHVRLAIMHEALGQRDLADRAVTRAVLVDGRLAADACDPPQLDVFGTEPREPLPAVAVRGLVILDAIATGAAETPDDVGDALGWLRRAWAARWSPAGKGSATGERPGR